MAAGPGSLVTAPWQAAVAKGYAAASTDTGHATSGGSFALGHPEKMTDFAYRSVHEMTVAAKAIVAAYYGHAPAISYWNGCSTGGRQGLTEAQRYPTDYNAIIAGAPANNRTHLYSWSLSIAQAIHKDEASYIPPSKYAMIHKAALDACDALDGLKDGLIGDPFALPFRSESAHVQGQRRAVLSHGAAGANGSTGFIPPRRIRVPARKSIQDSSPEVSLAGRSTLVRNRYRSPRTASNTSHSAIRTGTFRLSISIATWPLPTKWTMGRPAPWIRI